MVHPCPLLCAAQGEASPRKGAGKSGEDETREATLKRILVVDRMKSLVLMRDRDSHVEQMSRYESAFLKMARAAGFSDPCAHT